MNSVVAEAPLKAPFPWMGGKARVADLVWDRLGNVDNFVEPFAGSLAVLLRRPSEHFADGYRVETVNDLNHYLINFWRAVRFAPDQVAEWADWPVTEGDLHARHKWLVCSQEVAEWRELMRTDPEAFDAKIAGWWCWGQCCWIGGQWCADNVPQSDRRPTFSFNNLGPGVRSNDPSMTGGPTDWKQRPEITSVRGGGTGVHSGADETSGRPQLTDAFDIGRGVNAGGSLKMPRMTGARKGDEYYPGIGVNNQAEDSGKRPILPGSGHAPGPVIAAMTIGTCDARREWLTAWMRRLSDRLRLVRTCYGHWSRVCDSDSTLTRLGTTGVFLDPPYPVNRGDTGKASRSGALYATDKGADLDGLRDEVLAWCRKWGQDKAIRVAVCGYEGDGYEALMADGWTEHSWAASGGYGNQRKGKGKSDNAARERIWFSPACVIDDRPTMADLFAGAA